MLETSVVKPKFGTLGEMLRDQAEASPNAVAYRFIVAGDELEHLTFRALEAQALAVAERLVRDGRRGERALLLYRPGLEFTVAFFACALAGVVAVPANPPEPARAARALPRLLAIIEDAEASLLLSSRTLRDFAESVLPGNNALLQLPFYATDPGPAPMGDSLPAIAPEALAFLQYTSGSTSTPRGVAISHEAVMRNLAMIDARLGPTMARAVSWVPFYHDLGLIGGVLLPIYAGGTSVLLSPLEFLQRPLTWLKLVTRYRATATSAPNFALDLCCARVDDTTLARLDLSSLACLCLGAEPIQGETLERFAERFAAAGFDHRALIPGYGLAESVLSLTVSDPEHPWRSVKACPGTLRAGRYRADPTGVTVVGCGRALDGVELRIVDGETGLPLPDGSVGEIWARSPSVAGGYWRAPEATAANFEARVSGDPRPFLKTGDLGFLDGGELYVSGRKKEMIIVRGRNYFPQDIERVAVNAHPAIRVGSVAAFALARDGGEELGLVAEVQARKLEPGTDYEDVVALIRQAVTDAVGLTPRRVALIPPRALPKTSSGKIQRLLAHEWLVNHRFELLADRELPGEPQVLLWESPRPELEAATFERRREIFVAWMCERLSEAGFPTTPADRQRSFVELGLDSRSSVEWTADLATACDIELDPSTLYSYSDLESLAAYLLEEMGFASPGASVQDTSGAVTARDDDVTTPRAAAPTTCDVAIVGVGCRFPGGVVDPDSFWTLLEDRQDATGPVPAARWDAEALYDPNPGVPGRCVTRAGGFLDDIAGFDAAFFGISPREAERMDPQQRLLLTCAWEALESAHIVPGALSGSDTGVFVGLSQQEYAQRAGLADDLDGYALTGNSAAVVSGRLSYLLGLKGPSLTVDTACSSSLVGVHLAARSLAQRECSLALAGGVTLLLSPTPFLAFSRLGGLAPDGRCKTFDASADGVAWSEGCGVLALKRLDDARADGDPILAVLRGSAVNQDGRSNGLTAPNGLAQQDVVRRALDDAGLSPSQIDYVECHGTGTALGDPIEATALGAVFSGRPDARPLQIGSVKTNFGHAQAAAGVAGVIKVALALQRGALPASLNFSEPSPHIAWARLPLEVVDQPRAWRRGDVPRRAGVSSFGISGTNAHVILEEAPAADDANAAAPEPAESLVLLSARSAPALAARAARLEAWLARHPHLTLGALAPALALGRSHFEHRLALIAEDIAQLRESLRIAGEGRRPRGTTRNRCGPAPKVALLFSSQGSQRPGMGRELRARFEVFDRAWLEVSEALDPWLPRPLAEVVDAAPESPEAALLDRTEWAQPALFALELSLARLWRSFGLVPEALLGHSLGELVAAQVAGVLSLADASRLVCARGRLMQACPSGGAMVAIAASEAELAPVVAILSGHIDIAALNGPCQTVVSGDPDAVADCAAHFERQGRRVDQLRVSHAFHSAHMDAMLEGFAAELSRCELHPPRIPIVSNLSGALVDSEAITRPEYWLDHARRAVRFSDGVATLCARGVRALVECGPSGALSSLAKACITPDADMTLAPSLREGRGEVQALLEATGALYAAGVTLDLAALFPARRPLAPLPSYPFENQRFWLEGSIRSVSSASPSRSSSTLVELDVRVLGPTRVFEIEIPPAHGDAVMNQKEPRLRWTISAALALRAARRCAPDACLELAALERVAPAAISRVRAARCQIRLDPRSASHDFAVYVLDPFTGDWTLHLRGTVTTRDEPPRHSSSLDELRARVTTPEAVEDFVARCRRRGLDYLDGPHSWLRQIARGDGELLAALGGPDQQDDAPGVERFAQACREALGALCPDDGRGSYQVCAADTLWLDAELDDAAWIHGQLHGGRRRTAKALRADLSVFSADGRLLAQAYGLRLEPTPRERPLHERLQPLTADERRPLVESFLTERLARSLDLDPGELDPLRSLTELGLDSMVALELVNEIEAQLQLQLDVGRLAEGTSVASLTTELLQLSQQAAEHAAAANPAVADRALIQLKQGAPRAARLFLIHPVGGSALCYADLARAMNTPLDIVGLQHPRLSGEDVAYATLEEMAEDYARRIRVAQPEGPLHIAGWSMGGVIAFEVARQLAAESADLRFVGIFDGLAPGTHAAPAEDLPFLLSVLAQDLGILRHTLDLEALARGSLDEGLRVILRAAKDQEALPWNARLEDLQRLFELFRQNLDLLQAYRPGPYAGAAHVYRATDPLPEHAGAPADLGWSGWAKVANEQAIEASHFTLVRGANAAKLAHHLDTALEDLGASAQ